MTGHSNPLREAIEDLASGVNLGSTRNLDGLDAVRRTTESLIAQEVGRARRDGISWVHIGDALGITAQGAQQRYRDAAPRVRNRAKRS